MLRENQARMYDWVAGCAGGVAVPGSLAQTLGTITKNNFNMEYLFVILPVAIVLISSWFLYKSMEDDNSVKWGLIVLSIVTILVIYGWLLYAPSIGFISGIFEFIFAAGASILSGIMLLGALPRNRKLFSILIIVVSPIIMFVCLNAGMKYHPTSVARRNGDEIAVALENYHNENGSYPKQLDNLTPDYLSEIKTPNTIWGWLYKLEGDDYVLGFVTWVDWSGYSLDILRSSSKKWESVHPTSIDNSHDPFQLGPTPTDW
jgi:hypothetical protein